MHLRRPSTGVSTEDSDDEGGTGGTGGANPGSSNEYSLITVKHKRGNDGGGQRTENGVLRKLKHIFPNTYQRINSICSPAKVGLVVTDFNYQPGS